jgi:hypothetical protein
MSGATQTRSASQDIGATTLTSLASMWPAEVVPVTRALNLARQAMCAAVLGPMRQCALRSSPLKMECRSAKPHFAKEGFETRLLLQESASILDQWRLLLPTPAISRQQRNARRLTVSTEQRTLRPAASVPGTLFELPGPAPGLAITRSQS